MRLSRTKEDGKLINARILRDVNVVTEKIQLTEELIEIKCYAPQRKNLEWLSVSRTVSVISKLPYISLPENWIK
jgi:hypothetical protein